jgi:glycosyltransferase involved in cell wall biosynthesis
MVCVARLEAVKDHATLLDAFARLLDSGRSAELVLVGDGTLRSDLEATIRRRGLGRHVTLTGIVPNSRLAPWLRSADVFVLASSAEGLPVALAEAMACGLASVAADVNGIPELISPNETGLLFNPGDAQCLFGHLARLADDPAFRMRLGRAARRRIVASYDARDCVRRLAALLRDPGGVAADVGAMRPEISAAAYSGG